MTAEPNIFDVHTGALIAQANAFTLLVRMLEANGALRTGAMRDGLARMAENQSGSAPPHQREYMKMLLAELDSRPPRSPERSL